MSHFTKIKTKIYDLEILRDTRVLRHLITKMPSSFEI